MAAPGVPPAPVPGGGLPADPAASISLPAAAAPGQGPAALPHGTRFPRRGRGLARTGVPLLRPERPVSSPFTTSRCTCLLNETACRQPNENQVFVLTECQACI